MAKAKGVKTLKDTVPDNEIVRLGEVVNEPNYIFPDGNFGITGKYADYSLVEKKISYRTGKEDDGKYKDCVIEYTEWKDYPCYYSTITDIFKAYARINNLTAFKTKKLMSTVDELIEIHKNTYELIDKALGDYDMKLSNKQEETVRLADKKLELEDEIEQLRGRIDTYKKLDKEIDKMYNKIKEKTTIIVNRDKSKVHRVKEEK